MPSSFPMPKATRAENAADKMLSTMQRDGFTLLEAQDAASIIASTLRVAEERARSRRAANKEFDKLKIDAHLAMPLSALLGKGE